MEHTFTCDFDADKVSDVLGRFATFLKTSITQEISTGALGWDQAHVHVATLVIGLRLLADAAYAHKL